LHFVFWVFIRCVYWKLWAENICRCHLQEKHEKENMKKRKNGKEKGKRGTDYGKFELKW
jgi:hypothetical protein